MTKELKKAKKHTVAAYKHLEKAYNHMPNPCLKTECHDAQIILHRIERILRAIESEYYS